MAGVGRSSAWVALVWALACARVALGADAGAEAQRRFEEGKRLYRQAHDVEGARAKFAQAYALAPRPEILWNLAVCELDLGRAEDAVRHLRAYARDPEAREALAARVPDLVRRARASLGAIRVVAPREAAVRVDGHLVDPRDWRDEPVDLAPGDRVLVVDVGGERHEDIVSVRALETVERRFEAAAPAPAPAAAAPEPSARAPSLVPAPPEPPARVGAAGDATWPIVLAGLGLVGAGAGVAFALASRADADDAARARVGVDGLDCRVDDAPACTALRGSLDAGRTNAWLAVGSYAAAAVLLGTAGGLAASRGAFTARATPAGLLVRVDY